MNQPDFLASLEAALQLRNVAFSRAALQAFVADAWVLIEDNPDVDHWLREFIDTADVMMMA